MLNRRTPDKNLNVDTRPPQLRNATPTFRDLAISSRSDFRGCSSLSLILIAWSVLYFSSLHDPDDIPVWFIFAPLFLLILFGLGISLSLGGLAQGSRRVISTVALLLHLLS